MTPSQPPAVLARLEQWLRDNATTFATSLFASDFTERADELATLRACLAQQGAAWSDALPVTPPPVVESSLWIDSRALERVAASGAAQVNLYRSKPSHRYDRQHVPLFTHPAAVAVDEASVQRALALCPTDFPHLDRCRWIAKHITAALQPAATSEVSGND